MKDYKGMANLKGRCSERVGEGSGSLRRRDDGEMVCASFRIGFASV